MVAWRPPSVNRGTGRATEGRGRGSLLAVPEGATAVQALRNPPGSGVLQVEPTDHCNLRCRMCAPHAEQWESVHGVAKGWLDPVLWARVCRELAEDDVRFDHIIFQWLGDPSLHPELPALVATAARTLAGRVGYLRIDTNAIRLGADRAQALLAPFTGPAEGGPPLLLVFTIDAHTAPTYARVKGRDALAQVRANVRRILRLRRRLGARVNVQVQFVVQEGNAHEAGDFLRWWRDLLVCQGGAPRWHDEILFKRLSVGGGGPGQAAADDRYEATMDRFGIVPGPDRGVWIHTWARRPWQADDRVAEAAPAARGPGPGLWLTPVLRHDGVLVMCCADLGSTLQLGSLHEARFSELWTGPAATRHRLDHLAGRFTGACAACGGINWYDTTPEMAAAARARGAELGL